MGTKESRDKYKNNAKSVDYNFNQDLDEDIKTSKQNLAQSESKLGEWTISTEPKWKPSYEEWWPDASII